MRCFTNRGVWVRVAAPRPVREGRGDSAPAGRRVRAPAGQAEASPGTPAPAAPARPARKRATTARPRATSTGRARTVEGVLALRDRLARPCQTLDQIRRPDGSRLA